MPSGRWIGIKYLAWNLPDGKSVHLESWIDSVSGGVPAKAIWSKVGEVVDSGNWPAAPSAITGCSYSDPKTVITQGHGTFLLRTDADTAEYTMVSLREIVPPTAPSALAPRRTATRPAPSRLDILPASLRHRRAEDPVTPNGKLLPH
jgi:hypothetical protein